jgi:hypothetical protein
MQLRETGKLAANAALNESATRGAELQVPSCDAAGGMLGSAGAAFTVGLKEGAGYRLNHQLPAVEGFSVAAGCIAFHSTQPHERGEGVFPEPAPASL